jgi:hypothetical protein
MIRLEQRGVTGIAFMAAAFQGRDAALCRGGTIHRIVPWGRGLPPFLRTAFGVAYKALSNAE